MSDNDPDPLLNQLRCRANEIILELFEAKATEQLRLLYLACRLSLQNTSPELLASIDAPKCRELLIFLRGNAGTTAEWPVSITVDADMAEEFCGLMNAAEQELGLPKKGPTDER